MRKHHSIQPFPTEIDRNHFASWLSGFTDGEGCFRLTKVFRDGMNKYETPVGEFDIGLRSDDTAILRCIQSFFQCGRIYQDDRSYSKHSPHPKTVYRVVKAADLMKLVEHFDNYPLLAKKRRDYVIWREAVVLLYTVSQRPFQSRRGRIPRWTDAERQHFFDLRDTLARQRKYESPDVNLPSSPEPVDPFGDLFGD